MEMILWLRDPLGKTLYYGLDERGRMYFASEMKSITDQCVTFHFSSGHFIQLALVL
jgi:asparagine synthase (glutamine-hydrolysing)